MGLYKSYTMGGDIGIMEKKMEATIWAINC